MTGDIAGALAEAEVMVESDYATSFQAHMAIEREAAIAWIDEAGRITVSARITSRTGTARTLRKFSTCRRSASASSRRPSAAASAASRTSGCSPRRRSPLSTPRAGATRVLAPRSDERRAQAPSLRMSLRRRGEARRQTPGNGVRGPHQQGRLRFGGTLPPQLRGHHECRPLSLAGGGARARAIYSNGPKAGQFRGFGTPQAAFAMECALDELCERSRRDPLDLRIRNALVEDEITGLGYRAVETLDFRKVLEAIVPDYREMQRDAESFNADCAPPCGAASASPGCGIASASSGAP